MRGEHCIAGATILSAISVLLLIFTHIGQISPGGLTNAIYYVQLDVSSYGNAFESATALSAGGLYDTAAHDPMGESKGLRQYYRYGIYKGCGYQKDGSGTCNSTTVGYAFEPLSQMLADTPAKFKGQTNAIIPQTASAFRNNSYNYDMSRAASLMVFIGSCLAVLALIFGLLKARISFFVAAGCAGLSAFLLMIGAALWTAVIAKDAWLKNVKVQHGDALGIYVTPGPALYLTWVAFVLETLAVLPYVVSCCTYRSK